jgi:hypothetical protein
MEDYTVTKSGLVATMALCRKCKGNTVLLNSFLIAASQSYQSCDTIACLSRKFFASSPSTLSKIFTILDNFASTKCDVFIVPFPVVFEDEKWDQRSRIRKDDRVE